MVLLEISGTLSAWLVWGMLGLYPLTGTTTYIVGSPTIDQAVIHLPSGKPKKSKGSLEKCRARCDQSTHTTVLSHCAVNLRLMLAKVLAPTAQLGS